MSDVTQPPANNDIQMEIRFASSPATVWSALTEDIGQWWPDDFYAGGKPTARTFALEARPGGRMHEAWDNDGGVLWGTVVTVDRPRVLQVMGTTFPNWGGPSIWFGTWELEASGDGTVVKFSESTVGTSTEFSLRQKTEGWEALMEAMREFVDESAA